MTLPIVKGTRIGEINAKEILFSNEALIKI